MPLSALLRFAKDGDPEYYFGSADWMPRNLDRRVGVVTPIASLNFQDRLQGVLEVCLADNRQAWDLYSDGSYVQRESGIFAIPISPLRRDGAKGPGRPPSSTAEFAAFTKR